MEIIPWEPSANGSSKSPVRPKTTAKTTRKHHIFSLAHPLLSLIPDATEIIVQVQSAFFFGRFAVFSDRYAETDPVKDLVQQNGLGPYTANEWRDQNDGFFEPIHVSGFVQCVSPLRANEVDFNPCRSCSSLALVRFVVESDLYSWYTEIAAESWPGVTFGYRAVGPSIAAPSLCQAPASLTAAQGIVSDWSWFTGVPNPGTPST